MRLPNAELAIVPIEKLRDYSLNPTHEEGKHKAHLFAATIGISVEDAYWLRDQLLHAARNYECVLGRNTPFGQRYILDFVLRKDAMQAKVRSVWNILPNQTAPRLITCYVL